MQELKLKNGGLENTGIIAVVTMSLERLLMENGIAFYDLVMKCRDDEYEPFGNSDDILKAAVLMEQGGTIRQDIKNIVLSSVEGDEGGMHMVDPIDRS